MAELRRFGPLDFLLLLTVVAVAGGLRAGYLMACADGSRGPGYVRVQERAVTGPDSSPTEVEDLIAAVRDGSLRARAPFARAAERTAHVSPGYPYLVGLLARVTPDEKLFSTVRWVQAGLGAVTAGLYFLLARRSFRSLTVALVAGLLVAANPFSVIGTATIDDGVLASFALAGALFLAGRAGEEGGAFASLTLGLVLAGAALVRAAFLPFSFAALIWFLIRSRALERGWLCALVAFLGFVLGLAPWGVRNYQAIQEPVPVVSTTYLHLWVGNNEHATGGPATAEAWAGVPANELAAVDNQVQRYERLAPRIRDEIQARPVQAVRRRLHAFLAFWVGDNWLKDGTLHEELPVSVPEDEPEERERQEQVAAKLRERAPMVLQSWLAGMLILGLIGWRWSYAYRWESIPVALAAFWVPLPYVLGHAEALSGPRLPLDGVLLCFAALALVGLLPTSGPLLNPEPSPTTQENC